MWRYQALSVYVQQTSVMVISRLVVGCLWGLLLLGNVCLAACHGELGESGADSMFQGTIVFASVGRAHFAFDLYATKIPDSLLEQGKPLLQQEDLQEIKLTDGVSVNYNGKFVEGTDKLAVLARLGIEGVNAADVSRVLMFVSERGGSSRIYFNLFFNKTQTIKKLELGLLKPEQKEGKRREATEEINGYSTVDSVVVDAFLPSEEPALHDRPAVFYENIVFVSTAEASQSSRQSWAAVYSTNLWAQKTVRLSPKGVADFSPAISPSGEWVAVASTERTGFQGEAEELNSDLYVFKTRDGSHRRLVTLHGGWPSWADDRTIFFHRQADDGWWSVFRVTFPDTFLSCGEGEVHEERITPPGLHAMTPAASLTGQWVAVATRRPGSEFRHIELFDLSSHSFVKLTENISPSASHYSPFISSQSGLVGYHRCRGNPGGSLVAPLLEPLKSPLPGLSLLRIDGTFPSFSPDGSLMAFIGSREGEGIYVSNLNGTGQRKVFSGACFSTSWDPKRKGVLYSSYGPMFRSLSTTVHIISVHNAHGEGELSWKQLTTSGNNGFPWPSPDGKYLVFRSGRSGYKNLYIMDAVDGEEKEIRRLTEGPWIDQHPTWSPSGEWIAFASNREGPGGMEAYSVYLIHPNGTGLHKILNSSQVGLAVHPKFSPDGKKLVYSTDLAGDSGEPVGVPHQFTPAGEIYVADLDGSNIRRVTHNDLEDSTPGWHPSYLSSAELTAEGQILKCDFEDQTWLISGNQKQSDFRYSYSSKLPPTGCHGR